MNYIPGDFWRVCDRCGFLYRASMTFKTWDGLYVCREDFETRHPQDFVRGRKDNQNVPGARPEGVDNIIGPLTTFLTGAVTAGSTTLNVESSARFEAGDHIGVIVDSGATIARIVSTVPTGTSLTITAALRASASTGAIVINNSAVAEADIG